jgi:pantetheine-phosphate adenylyltransferase/16S rRNA (guanine(966)-N(2))-methyltransferase RsmD
VRIVGGTARGRRLEAPRGSHTRPTADRVRQSIFDTLGQFFDGGAVLDLYAGSGAMGLEALSRGAERAVLVDRDREAVRCCRNNATALGLAARVEVLPVDVAAAVERLAARGQRFDLVFVDPPYAEGPEAALAALDAAGIVAPGGRVVAEHDRRHPPPDRAGLLSRTDRRTFGDTAVSFYEPTGPEGPARPPGARMKRVAIYPGSFDPLTNGHLSIIRRGLEVFDGLIVAIANNTKKAPLFTVEERREMLLAATCHDPRIEVDSFQGLLVDYARSRQVKVVIRGLRAVSDFEFEFQLANMNRKLDPNIDTMFMMTGEEEFYISSHLVREVASFGGDVQGMVPDAVYRGLKAKFEK